MAANDSLGNLELFIRRFHENGLSNQAVFARIVRNSDKSRENESVKCSRLNYSGTPGGIPL